MGVQTTWYKRLGSDVLSPDSVLLHPTSNDVKLLYDHYPDTPLPNDFPLRWELTLLHSGVRRVEQLPDQFLSDAYDWERSYSCSTKVR